MVKRTYWIKKIEDEWQRKNIVWLSGVRRAGKTFLCLSLDDVEYFDCELPSVRQQLEDPETFLSQFRGKRIVLDEIHRLLQPTELLKIAADYFPDIKVVATGSATLQASNHFQDKLTGRKSNIWLSPMISNDLEAFGGHSLNDRLKRGGLPPFYEEIDNPSDYQEWIDSYWAKDIQELFRLQQKRPFQRFVELVMSQSGRMFESSRFASQCEVSRSTIGNYLAILENTWVAHVIKPFSTRKSVEIVSAPKVYGFDTGFVTFFQGWSNLRPTDCGLLWEHYVLNEILAKKQPLQLNYWRDKQGHEIDFVWVPKGKAPITIECKWQSHKFDPRNLIIFRRKYSQGKNFVIAPDIKRSFQKKYSPEITVDFINIEDVEKLKESATVPL